ncbi:uncharacterized protein LOC133188081 [Saccostrea echinata]|uniref:uncharacterized protein LOC133188081 n=1 Tax=Saccostrea echinata TaxID=191078 RepID=UPI002A7FF59B|nr:uncharacterized protein LOC133188081 [Saccostrea echinata]
MESNNSCTSGFLHTDSSFVEEFEKMEYCDKVWRFKGISDVSGNNICLSWNISVIVDGEECNIISKSNCHHDEKDQYNFTCFKGNTRTSPSNDKTTEQFTSSYDNEDEGDDEDSSDDDDYESDKERNENDDEIIPYCQTVLDDNRDTSKKDFRKCKLN